MPSSNPSQVDTLISSSLRLQPFPVQDLSYTIQVPVAIVGLPTLDFVF